MPDGWFTVEKIDGETFAISEYRHWEEPHSYLLLGKKMGALIDTGLGVANIPKIVDGITQLPLMVMTTHVHWDHIGGHKYFKNTGVHEAEEKWLSGQFPLPLKTVKENLTCHPCDFPPDFRIEDYRIPQVVPQWVFRDGDCLDLGGRRLQVVHTPGHSPGHCCFYEPERHYLYSGDLLYSGCLDAFYPTTDPRLFWKSVKKVQKLDVDRILPGHHTLALPADFPRKVDAGFHEIWQKGILRQGSGVFDFGEFQIHI